VSRPRAISLLGWVFLLGSLAFWLAACPIWAADPAEDSCLAVACAYAVLGALLVGLVMIIDIRREHKNG
jgi:hypothetical protein